MPYRPPFPIPEDIHADPFCLCIKVPNDPTWKRVVAGLLDELNQWYNWQRDEEKSGKELAQVWRTLYAEIDWTTMSCCCDQPPAIFRYNDAGVYQRSTDGGTTWVDSPEYDYRNTSTTFPPPSAMGISNTRCQAADGVVKTIDNEIIQGLSEAFAAAQILALIAVVLLSVLSAGSLAALTPLISAIGAAIIDVGVTATQAAFTSDVWDRLRCNITTHMVTDDSINASGFEGVLSEIMGDETGIVQSVLYGIVNAAGVVGINNMIRSNKGDPDADCSDCDFCYLWDFSSSNGDWYTNLAWPGGGGAGATYGGGWNSAHPGGSAGPSSTDYIVYDLPSSINVSKIIITFSNFGMTNDAGDASGALAAGSPATIEINAARTQFVIYFYDPSGTGSMTIDSIEMHSHEPFPAGLTGGDNC